MESQPTPQTAKPLPVIRDDLTKYDLDTLHCVYLHQMLKKHGNAMKASKEMRVSPQTAYRWTKRFAKAMRFYSKLEQSPQ